MIEVTISLSETHKIVIADGQLALEVDGHDLYSEPLEIAAPKVELLYAAMGIAREEMCSDIPADNGWGEG